MMWDPACKFRRRETGRGQRRCGTADMEDQKAENLLNLALSVPEETRERDAGADAHGIPVHPGMGSA